MSLYSIHLMCMLVYHKILCDNIILNRYMFKTLIFPIRLNFIGFQNFSFAFIFNNCVLKVRSATPLCPSHIPNPSTFSLCQSMLKRLPALFFHFPTQSPFVFATFTFEPVAFWLVSSSLKSSFNELSSDMIGLVSSAY